MPLFSLRASARAPQNSHSRLSPHAVIASRRPLAPTIGGLGHPKSLFVHEEVSRTGAAYLIATPAKIYLPIEPVESYLGTEGGDA